MLLKCAAHGYTLHEKCPVCGASTSKPGPAKYSPEDPYGKYRRQLKLIDAKSAKAKGGA